ncbi:helix-turn-helix domain-containing protein [Pigmentiphaga litoralis]|uniref:helix-turn-helix domain-containing protein n=1 Tax=Pigmentiphaga litoralis TaxID=516702 RepID=UPI003B427937
MDGSVVTVVTQHMEHLLAPTPELLGCFGSAQVLHWPAGQPSPAARSLEHLLEEFDTHGPWRLVALETLLRLVLVMLAREVGVRAEQALNARPSRAVQHVQSFKAMLNQCFREQRDIGYYAGHLGITPTQLNRVCRDALGQSALEVVHNRLVMEAKRDLAYSSLSIKEIAIALGFSDPGYFSRFFTRQTQYSPTDFRVLARERLAQDRGAPVRVAADPA